MSEYNTKTEAGIKAWNLILKYQRDNNVKGQCLSHALFWNDFYRFYLHGEEKLNVKVGSLLIGDYDNETFGLVAHCFLQYEDGLIVDPSVEFKDMKYDYRHYCTSLKEVRKILKEQKFDEPKLFEEHVEHLVGLQKTVNDALNDFRVSTDYYKDLSIYVSKNLHAK